MKVTVLTSLIVFIVCIIGAIVSLFISPPIFLDILELAVVAFFCLVFFSLIPKIFPKKVRAEAVFLGGAAKAPYVSADELYGFKRREKEEGTAG
jgi:hypothetical protein